MSRILDQKNFRWTSSAHTDVMATFKQHGFKKTTAKERARHLQPTSGKRSNVHYLPLRKGIAA